jgi:hypothetical protein
MKDTLHYPPAWNLNGEGFIIPFLANKELLLKEGFIDEKDKLSYLGGLGAIMLVNYESSDVGPYFELLFIPGDFKHTISTNGFNKIRHFKKITKIFVSSQISIQEGRLNWAIPKEFANFSWVKNKNKTSVNIATANGDIFFKGDFTKRFFPFPVTTKLYPISLLQKSESGNLLNTEFSGNGYGKFSTMENIQINKEIFPNLFDIAKFSICLGVENFKIVFPIPKIYTE